MIWVLGGKSPVLAISEFDRAGAGKALDAVISGAIWGASGTGCALGEAPAISFSGKGVGEGVGKGAGKGVAANVLGSGAGKASEAMAVMPAGGMDWASLEAAVGRGLGCACGLG